MAKESLTEQIALTEVVAQEAPKKTSGVALWLTQNGVFLFLVVLAVFAAFFVNGFGSLDNVTNILNRAVPLGIVAVGMTFVVISGNYLDLSVVAQVATSGVIFLAVGSEYGLGVAALAATGAAILYGLVNGLAVGLFKANAVIVTLATTYIGLGLLRYFSGGSIFFGPPDGPMDVFGSGKVGPVPYSAFVFLGLTLVLSLVLTRTNFGFLVKSFGVNERATRLGGVNTDMVIVGAFLVTALAAMIAGFVFAAFSNTAVSTMAQGFDFKALGAIIIGGTSVFGGRGSVLRTLLGVIFVSVLDNVLTLLGFTFGFQQLALGVLILLAVTLDVLSRKLGQQ